MLSPTRQNHYDKKNLDVPAKTGQLANLAARAGRHSVTIISVCYVSCVSLGHHDKKKKKVH